MLNITFAHQPVHGDLTNIQKRVSDRQMSLKGKYYIYLLNDMIWNESFSFFGLA